MANIKGVLRKTAKGFNTYDLEGAEADLFFPVLIKLEKKFAVEALHAPVYAFDQLGVDLKKGDIKIVLGWDIWSDLFVMAIDKNGDPLIEEIGKYLSSIMEELHQIQEEQLAKKEENNNDIS